MKKIVLALLLVLIFASSTTAKVMVITSNKTGASSSHFLFNGLARSRGLQYDMVVADDTTAVWNMARSGRYTSAILITLPALTASYQTAGQLETAGWKYIDRYINRNSVNAFPIPLIVPLVSPPPAAGVWAVEYTGQMSVVGAQTLDTQPLTDANGDSIYTHMHATGAGTMSRIADSLSWVEAMVWRDAAIGGTTTQKYATMWRTIGTGKHQVIYVLGAEVSYGQGFYAAVLGMFEPCRTVDVSPLCMNYGYVGASSPTNTTSVFGTSVDTVSFGYNLNRLVKDVVVPNNIKLDFLVDTYSMDNQNKTNIKTIITLAAAYPDNVRMTHYAERGWNVASNADWTGYATAGTYSQMLKRIGRSIDSTATHYPIDANRMYANGPGPGGGYAGLWASPWNMTVCTKIDSVFRAMTASNIRDAYIVTSARSGQAPPTTPNYGVISAGRTWVGEDHKELRLFPISYAYCLSSVHATIDTLRIAYGARAPFRWQLARSSHISQVFNYILEVRGLSGVYAAALSTSNKVARATTYGPGVGYPIGVLTGGSRLKYAPYLYASIDSSRSVLIAAIKEMDQEIKMCNYLVATYGTSGVPAYTYTWLNEIKLDRTLNRPFVNSHVRYE